MFKKAQNLGYIFSTTMIEREDRNIGKVLIMIEMVETSFGKIDFYIHINSLMHNDLILLKDVLCKYKISGKDLEELDFIKKLYYSIMLQNLESILKEKDMKEIIDCKIDYSSIIEFEDPTPKQKESMFNKFKNASEEEKKKHSKF